MTPRKVLATAVGVLPLIAGLYVLHLATPKYEYFLERRGTLVDERVDTTIADGLVRSHVHLRSSSGLSIDLRLVRPIVAAGETLPAIVMLGGEATGRNAVDLVGRPEGVAYVALDYPYDGMQELDAFWESVVAIPGIQQAFLDSPPALLLAGDWLERQEWLDHSKVELVGASLGVPFTAVAGALDTRFTRVWLLHGGARNYPWVMHVGRRYVENDLLRSVVARTTLLLVHGASFEVEDWIPEIAPRPLVIVAAKEDDFVPPAAQAPFVESSASDHVELIWTEGKHILPSREAELQQLVELVLSRIG